MPVLRTCIDCDNPIRSGATCPDCRLERDRTRRAQRGSRQERGYDSEHQRTRAELIPLAIGQPCPRCGEPMEEGQALDLGHTVARALDPNSRGDRIEHASCNRSAGARY